MEQIFIAFTGVIAIFLSQSLNPSLRKFSSVFGLCGQPFWFYTSYKNHQWGIFILCFFYTYSWLTGIYNYWIKK